MEWCFHETIILQKSTYTNIGLELRKYWFGSEQQVWSAFMIWLKDVENVFLLPIPLNDIEMKTIFVYTHTHGAH